MIYLDNHATTRCDPRVVEAMVPWLSLHYGNPHSESHELGRHAAAGIEKHCEKIAAMLNVPADSVVMTSGATESNNLAIRGVCLHPRQKRRHIVTVTTEHPSVLDVASDLSRDGFRITVVDAVQTGQANTGVVDLEKLADAIDEDTAIVSVMWANNEIGSITPMKQVADLCHSQGVLLHSDATQAIGRVPVDIADADVDLVSASAHKFYGPKGVGLLVVGNGNRRVRLRPEIVGGGQQLGLRSGTMNPASIAAMSKALTLANDQMETESARIARMRDELFRRLTQLIPNLTLNGPELSAQHRLPGNLNCSLPDIEGAAWMSAVTEVAFSSGSACSSSNGSGDSSSVLRAIGMSESAARRSVRFGLGRFNTEPEIQRAVELLVAAYHRLQRLTQ